MRPTLTVFTPTYNRAYCLHKGYEALRRQTSKDFVWIIIDDGSTDNTRQLVEKWQSEPNDFEIKYVYKENGGMYTGYNKAIEIADSELCVCVDSDDYLTDNAVELIIKYWKKNRDRKYAGIISLDCFKDGRIIGGKLPDMKAISAISVFLGKYKIKKGDRKFVVRTKLYKSVAPMEEFPGEKDFNPNWMHVELSRHYDYLVLNKRLCVVEYQDDSMSNTVYKQYLRSPRSFRKIRLQDMSLKEAPPLFIIKKTIHYISSCILSGEPCISESPRKALTVLLYPFGVLLTVYLKWYNKKH